MSASQGRIHDRRHFMNNLYIAGSKEISLQVEGSSGFILCGFCESKPPYRILVPLFRCGKYVIYIYTYILHT